MTIAEEISDLKSRVSAAFSACEDMQASMPAAKTTWTLADTIRTIPAGGGGIPAKEFCEGLPFSVIDSTASFLRSSAFQSLPIVYAEFANVKEIYGIAFRYCYDLKEARFPELTAMLSRSQFYYCTSLESVYMPKCVAIGSTNTFYNCSSLKTLDLGSFSDFSMFQSMFYTSSTTYPRPEDLTIGFAAWPSFSSGFISCMGAAVKRLALPLASSMSGFLDFTFNSKFAQLEVLDFPVLNGFIDDITIARQCPNLQELRLPALDTAPYAGNYAYVAQSCPSLRKVVLPSTTTVLPDFFCYNCPLTQVVDANGEDLLGRLTRLGITGWGMSELVIPACVQAKDIRLCSNLTRIYAPELLSVSNYGLDRNTLLTEVFMPKVTFLGVYGLASAYALRSVSLPAMNSVYGHTFEQCWNLASIYLRSPYMYVSTASTRWHDFDECGRDVPGGTTIYVPTSLVTYYKGLGGFSSMNIQPFDDWED